MRLLSGFQSSQDGAVNEVLPGADRQWSGVQAGSWLDAVLAELRDPARISAQENIPGFQADLRPYQTVGVNWLWFLSRLGLGGCLADDMGLGKTLQVLALLLRRKTESDEPKDPQAAKAACPIPERLPSLLVVPASLLANWRAELERFAPALTFVIVH